ncbi:hypothetical protein ACFTWH_14170 [Streptomyces sp. NPDC057011]|uniref:hypothetical protein n=1 Tax=unclassified Streptomyces TaxID=2593676 RepID=UPI0036339FD5
MGTRDAGGTGAKSPGRTGRKFGPLRDRSQEFNALARFLRTRVEEAGLTVADLVEPTGLKKSAISERLAGAKLDDAEFVDAVVVACTEARELLPRRARLRADAARLLQATQERSTPVPDLTRQPPAVRNTVMAAMETAQKGMEELLDVHRDLRRKSDELEALTRVQYESQLALREATELTSALSTWVIVLAGEVEQLTVERELTMTAQPPDLARLVAVDAELASVTSRHGRTAATLVRTEQERQLATELLAEALTRSRRVRREMRHLRAAVALPAADGTPAEPAAEPDGFASRRPIGDDIDTALERAEAVSRRIADRLSGALTALDPDAEAQPLSAALPVADNADNALTGADTADNPVWWAMVADVPTPTFLWAERTATELLQDRNPHDPRFGHITRNRPPREVLLLADRLQQHRWLEGGTRLRNALALSLEPEALAPLILALLDAGQPGMGRRQQGAQMLHEVLWTRPPSEVATLYQLMPYHRDEAPDVLRTAFRVAAQRPYADVVALVRELLETAPRHLYNSVLFEAIVRERPPAEVVDLVIALKGVADHGIDFTVFTGLPVPPIGHTELLVRLRAALGLGPFVEMLPGLYDDSTPDLADQIAELHGPWPDSLATAAENLRADVMPLIIRRTTLDILERITERLVGRGLSVAEVFGPYADLFPGAPVSPAD